MGTETQFVSKQLFDRNPYQYDEGVTSFERRTAPFRHGTSKRFFADENAKFRALSVYSMTSQQWTDMIVGDRMTVDQEFTQRVADSQFSRQEWGLIMTAVEFDIEHPADDEQAKLVADTSKVRQVMPEMQNIQSQMNAMAGKSPDKESKGIFTSVKEALGLGGGDGGINEDRLAAAERLAQEYADELQTRLEANDKWGRVRRIVQE